MTRQDYQLAAGHDNAAGLANIETLLPTYQGKAVFVQGRGKFDQGVLRRRADGLTYTTGFASVIWFFDVLSFAQWDHLQSNYCTGTERSGKVTVRTRGVDGTYANYNATMVLPNPPDTDRLWDVLRRAEIRFERLEAL